MQAEQYKEQQVPPAQEDPFAFAPTSAQLTHTIYGIVSRLELKLDALSNRIGALERLAAEQRD